MRKSNNIWIFILIAIISTAAALVVSGSAHAANITGSATNWTNCPGTTISTLNYKNQFKACMSNYWISASGSTADPRGYCDGTFQVAVGTVPNGSNIASWQTISCNGTTGYTISGMVSGTTYYVSRRQQGFYENTGGFSLETTKPGISSGEPASQWYNSNPGATINVTFTDNAAVCTVRYEVWSGSGKTGTNYVSQTTINSNIDSTSYNINGVLATPWASMGQGNNYFSFRALDCAGNAKNNNDPFNMKKDTVSPAAATVTPANGDDGSYVDGTFDLSTGFTDATSGVASCQYCKSTDGVCNTEWAAATWSAGTCSKTNITCTNGQSLTLNMRATDNAGNVGTGTQVTRTCDTIAPAAAAVTPDNNDTGTHVDGTFDVSAGFTDAAAGVASCQYCKSTDGVCNTEWAAATWNAGTCTKTNITCAEGQSLTLNMRATDDVGNVGTGTAVTRTCDAVAPAAATVTPENNDSGTHVDATFNVTTDFTENTSGVASCEYCKSTDGVCNTEWAAATWNAGTCSKTNITCTNGQSLTLNMRATDETGNLGTGTAVTRTCDNTAPAAATVTPDNTDSGTHVDATFDVDTDFTDAGAGVASCEYCKSTDGVCNTEWAAATWNAGTCSITGITCTDGQSLTLNMRATDDVGNLGTGTAVTRTCDDTAPAAAAVTPDNNDTGTHVDGTFDVSAGFTDAAAGVASCEYCKSTDGTCNTEWAAATWNAGTCSKTNITCAEGQSLTLNMRATDETGNLGTGTAVTRTCDAAAPVDAAVTPDNNDTGTHVDATFDVSTGFTDATSGVASCEYCKSTDGTCDGEWAAATWNAGTCSITNITCTEGQSLTLNMRATDETGNLGTGTPVTRTCDAVAPAAATVTPDNIDSGTHVDATFDVNTGFTDATSGVASCEYCKSTDGTCDAEWAAATWNAGTCSITNITCTDGDSLTLNMRATDETGNLGTGTPVTRTCDDTSPAAATVTPDNIDSGTHVDATFDVSAGFTDAAAGVASCEYCKSTDGTCDGEWAAATWNAGTCSITGITCTDGDSLTLNMRATDETGNLGTGTPVTRTCDDTTPAAATVTPDNNDTGTHVDATFDVSTGFTDAAAGVASCEYCKSTDGTCDGEWAAATWNAGTCSITNITCTEGQSLTLNMRATDETGNLGTGTPVTRTCDAVVPAAATVTPDNIDSGTRVDATFDVSTGFTDATSGVASCEYCKSTDGTCDAEWASGTWNAGTCSITNITCTDGDSLTLNMRATDETGNVGTGVAVTRTCDDTPPSVIATSITDAEPDGDLDSITFTFSEDLYGSGEIADWSLTDANGTTDLIDTLADGNVTVLGDTVTITLTNNTGTTGPPAYTYSQGGGNDLRDSVGNLVVAVVSTVASDTAPPVFMSSSSNRQITDDNMPSGTVITITFSEDVFVNGGQVEAADWTVANGGWHGGAAVTYADAAGYTMTATLSSDTTSNDWVPTPTMDRSGAGLINADSIEDSSGNDAVANAGADTIIVGSVDWTPPSDITTIYDGPDTGMDAAFATSSTTLKANWPASTDPETGISRYWYAIGTTSGATDVVDWTDNLTPVSLEATGLSLTDGETYYISVKAENGGALQSNPLSSDGQFVDASVPLFSIDALTSGTGTDCQYITGTSTVYYNNNTFCDGGAGDFSIEVSASDPHSGIMKVNFPVTTSAGTDDVAAPYSHVYSYDDTSSFSGTVTVTAYNNVVLTTVKTFDLLRDIVAPVTTDNWTDNWTYSSIVNITLSPTDISGSGVQGTLYCVDTDNTCTPSISGTTLTVNCADNTVCTQYVRYYSTDNVINDEVVNSKRVRQDRMVPIPTVIAPSNSDSGTHVDATFDLSTVFTSEGSDIIFCDYCQSTDGTCDTEWASATFSAPNTVTGTCSIENLTCIDLTTMTFNMRAINALGKPGAGTEVSRICDDVIPATIDNWTDDNWSIVTPITVSLTPADTGGSGVQDTFYCIDTDNTCTPSTSGTAPQVSCADGTYCTQYLRYFTRDNVDNDEAVKSQRVRQDIKVPTATISTPSDMEIIDGSTPIIGSATDENFKEYAIYYGPGENPTVWGTIIATSTTPLTSGTFTTWDTTNLYGTYTIRLRVVDLGGNISDETKNVGLFTSLTVTRTLPNNQWTMISMPGISLDPDPKSFLGDARYEVQRWDSYMDDNEVGLKYYINFSVTAGDAFWVKPYRGDITYTLVSWVADTTRDYEITMQEGWNQIGSPYNRDIAWSSLFFKRDGDADAVSMTDAITNEWINSVFYSYSDNDYQAHDVSENMVPIEGYFVKANEAGTLYVDPGAGTAEGMAKIVRPVYDWRLRISAETGDLKDSDNYVGELKGANEGFGKEDSAEPPVVEPYVSVYFPRDDWGRQSGKYAADIRDSRAGDMETERSWPFVVETSEPGQQVVISWPGSSAIPDNYDIRIREDDTGAVIDLRQNSEYSIITDGDGKKQLTVLARKTGLDRVEEVSRLFKAGWNLISVPLEPEDTDVRDQLGKALNAIDVYQFYGGIYYDPQSEDRVDIQAGIGYWMYTPEDIELEFSGNVVYEDARVDVPLVEGWNLIGNPFNSAVAWGDNINFNCDGPGMTLTEAVASGITDGKLFEYDGDEYTPVSSIQPWKGYVVKLTAECVVTLSQ